MDILKMFKKYDDVFFLAEFLKKVSTVAELLGETNAVQSRLLADVYNIFHKDRATGQLIGEGAVLAEACRVSSVNKSQTSASYLVEACIDLHCRRSDSESLTDGKAKKRKRDEAANSSSSLPPAVQLWYRFEEICVGDKVRASTVTVERSPCKIVTMSLEASRGPGLDRCRLIDYKLFTAGESPSTDRRVNYYSEQHKSRYSGNFEKSDTTDYVRVHVDEEYVVAVGDWIIKTILRREKEDTIIGSNGGENFLLFLLSLPYVDEAWGIHDSVMDCAFPSPESNSEGEGDGDEEVENEEEEE